MRGVVIQNLLPPCMANSTILIKKAFYDEYYKQKLPSENFFEVIQYIKYHDVGIVKRMSKKSRLEKLLEMVEMELKMKNTEEKDYGYDNMPELRRTNIG